MIFKTPMMMTMMIMTVSVENVPKDNHPNKLIFQWMLWFVRLRCAMLSRCSKCCSCKTSNGRRFMSLTGVTFKPVVGMNYMGRASKLLLAYSSSLSFSVHCWNWIRNDPWSLRSWAEQFDDMSRSASLTTMLASSTRLMKFLPYVRSVQLLNTLCHWSNLRAWTYKQLLASGTWSFRKIWFWSVEIKMCM